jgi:LuxR family maltose regulon positive regulatory protein
MLTSKNTCISSPQTAILPCNQCWVIKQEDIMPRTATYALIWSPERTDYELYKGNTPYHRSLQKEDERWFTWLSARSSFSFQGKCGHMTVRKESRPRGEGYWYAYRNRGRKTVKKYLGRTIDLTIASLEEAARALNSVETSLETNSSSETVEPALSSKTVSSTEHHESASRTPPSLPLLVPKLRLPRLRSSLVLRERLLEQLDAGLERKITLLSAPAGFGKTTLVSQWLADRSKRGNLSPVAWVSLDEGDNDPARFWRYLITACQAFQPDLGHTALVQLLSSQQLSFERAALETTLATFLNELTMLANGALLVLEDYHVITSPHIHKMMIFLIDHLPEPLHLIMLTRCDPPLPLARWRALDDLNELHAADMRFSVEEIAAFLQQVMPFPLSNVIVMDLATHTEGWVAGLRLMTLALQGRMSPQEIERFLTTFTGTHRHILEYLVTEVLLAQSEPVQQFLLQTTILDRLTGSLCNALTGRNDGDLLLEQLERANLFLLPLDESGQWYRYHTLFAEAMQHEARRRLGEEALCSLYARACDWYEQQGMLSEAVDAALSAHEFQRALDLILRVVGPQHFSEIQEYYTFRRWLEKVPEEVIYAAPNICFMYAVLLLFRPDHDTDPLPAQFERLLQAAEHAWSGVHNLPGPGTLLALRAMAFWRHGNAAQATTLASRALTLLPSEDMLSRGMCQGIVGGDKLLAGQLHAARQTLQAAMACFVATGNDHGLRAVRLMLGDVYAGQGELRRAAELYRQALATADKDLLDKSRSHRRLALLFYEWNDLATAEREAHAALDLGKHLAREKLQIKASLILVRVRHALGQAENAMSLLQSLALSQEAPRLTSDILALQARLQLAAGDLPSVQHWVEARHDESLFPSQQERDALIVARLLIMQNEVEEALRLLEQQQDVAHNAGRTRSVLGIQLLMALAHFAGKSLPQARQIIKEVLTLAHTEGYQRLFLDEGEAMATLLRTIFPKIKEDAVSLYARTLLLAFARELPEKVAVSPSRSALPAVLIEPLSYQEQRVLRLLVAGRSNPEIARSLVVSINTVKAHVKNIYRKLNVNNRVEACELARHLKLL